MTNQNSRLRGLGVITASALLIASAQASVFSTNIDYSKINFGKATTEVNEYTKISAVIAKLKSEKGATRKIASAPGFDVNDVSFLFPLDENGNPVPDIRISDTNLRKPLAKDDPDFSPVKQAMAGQPLLSEEAFQDILITANDSKKIGKGKNASSMQVIFEKESNERKNWRVYGVRYDPCAASVELDPKAPENPTRKLFKEVAAVIKRPGLAVCVQQLRLIVGPDSPNGNADRGVQDTAMHLVYVLGVGPINFNAVDKDGKPVVNPVIGFLQAFRDLSNALPGGQTAGKPLGVHPGLASGTKENVEKLKAAVAEKSPAEAEKVIGPRELMKRFVLRSVAESTLLGVAFMGLEDGGPEPWVFMSGTLERDDKKENDLTVQNRHWIVSPRATGFGPAMTPPKPLDAGTTKIKLSFIDDVHVIPTPLNKKESTAGLFDDASSGSKAANNAVYRVDNPRIANLLNRDCVSCHSGSSRIISGSIKPTADAFFPPDGITGFVAEDVVTNDDWNVRNFGYFEKRASVNLRALNETTEVVEYLNKNLGWSGPGVQCGSEAKTKELFLCSMGMIFGNTDLEPVAEDKRFPVCVEKVAKCSNPSTAAN